MKNMKKVLAVMTAVSAMAAQASAFAAPIAVDFDVANFDATYDVETNKFAVTLTDYTAAEDMTLLILDKDVADEANVQDGEIRYIDQGKAFANAGLKLDEAAEQLAPGSYPVKLGYDDGDSFEIAEATLVIPEPGSDEVAYVTWIYGNIDCDEDGYVNTDDCFAILGKATGDTTFGATEDFDGFTFGNTYITKDGQQFIYGNIDCDEDGYVNTDDCFAILGKATGDTTFGTTEGFDGFTFGQEYEINPTPVVNE